MLALAGTKDLPGVIVPGGVTLPARGAEDAGQVQSLGARFAHDLISLDYAATMGCRACGSSGGGCQFLGTAATSQVVAEALGLALPHSALAPSGEPVVARAREPLGRWRCSGCMRSASRSARSSPRCAVENAMLVHAAFGGSTNLLLHIPAIAARRGPDAADGRGLDPRQSRDAAPGGRAAERTARSSDGRRCSWPAACPK